MGSFPDSGFAISILSLHTRGFRVTSDDPPPNPPTQEPDTLVSTTTRPRTVGLVSRDIDVVQAIELGPWVGQRAALLGEGRKGTYIRQFSMDTVYFSFNGYAFI